MGGDIKVGVKQDTISVMGTNLHHGAPHGSAEPLQPGCWLWNLYSWLLALLYPLEDISWSSGIN